MAASHEERLLHTGLRRSADVRSKPIGTESVARNGKTADGRAPSRKSAEAEEGFA